MQRYGDEEEVREFLKRMKARLLRSMAEEMREYEQNLRREHEQAQDEIKKKLYFEN